MARLIAIECDSNEVRIAIGTSGLTGVSLEHVASAPIALDSNEEILNSVKTFEAIQALLKQLAVRSGNVIFCIGRSNIELRSLTLPTVEKNELPDMVRFAAQRQFANAGDSWPIDYVVMPSSQEGMTDCLAATINPATVDRINKIVLSLGLTLTQIVLRPMASATMAIVKQPQLANSAVLLMELFGDEADMAVMDQGNVVFMRNVRFSSPAEAESNSFALLGEIRRTLIAAASQRSNLNIQQVRIWGSGTQHADLCETLSLALEANVESLDPLDLFDASKTVRLVAGDNTGRFASAIGALLAPQVSDRLIDFSNPR
ncbi:MAG: type IV pilus biogenesis protein PilM, partial [Pirellula staleyi]